MDPLAIGSLVSGILSMPVGLCCTFFGIPLSLVAILLGVVAIINIGKAPETKSGKGLAFGGIATGSIGIILLIVGIFFGVASALMSKLGVSLDVRGATKACEATGRLRNELREAA